MSTSKDLLLSILSMDAYNREYNAGIADLGGLGSVVGLATILTDSETVNTTKETAQAVSFYAAAYMLSSGETVISYRGTDEPFQELLASDFPIFAQGDYDEPQLSLATKFHRAVKEGTSGNIVMTGHSLGGALAGFTGALQGEQSVLVDHIGFFDALTNFLNDWNKIEPYRGEADREAAVDAYLADHPEFAQQHPDLPEIERREFLTAWEAIAEYEFDDEATFDKKQVLDFLNTFTNVNSFYIEGSVANLVRGGIPVTQAILPSVIGAPFGGGSIAAHSASLNVVFKYAEQESRKALGVDTGANALLFKPVLEGLSNALFSDDIAQTLGLEGKGATGISAANEKMRSMIAYSTLDEGTLVFGDTGIRSMFNDVNELGRVYATAKDGQRDPFLNSQFPAIEDILAGFSVQYAGALAVNKIAREDMPGIENGVLKLSNDQEILALDLSSVLWEEALGKKVEPLNREEFLDAYFAQSTELQTFWTKIFGGYDKGALDKLASSVWGGEDRTIFDRIHMRTNKDTTTVDLPDRAYQIAADTGAGVHVDVYIGNQTNGNTITDSAGNDLIIGGDGDDVLYSTGGRDHIFAGKGNDRVVNIVSEQIKNKAQNGTANLITGSTAAGSSLKANFIAWVSQPFPGETTTVAYSGGTLDDPEDAGTDGIEIDTLSLDTYQDGEVVSFGYTDLATGGTGLDYFSYVEKAELTGRGDLLQIGDQKLDTPLFIDMGGFAEGSVTKDDWDELSYESVGHGLTIVNGATRAGGEIGPLKAGFGNKVKEILSKVIPYSLGLAPDVLALGGLETNDALRVVGAEKITGTNSDDTLWYGEVSRLNGLLGGWPADGVAPKVGEIDGGGGNDWIVHRGASYVLPGDVIPESLGGAPQTPNPETGEPEGGSTAAQELRLTLKGGSGDDRIMAVAGAGAIIAGGTGKDFLFNTTVYGQIYAGDIGQTGNEASRSNDGERDAIWYWPGVFVKDAEPEDTLELYGLPLAGGTNLLPMGGDLFSLLIFLAKTAQNKVAMDFVMPFVFYGMSGSGQLFVYNRLFDVDLPDWADQRLSNVMVIENYDQGENTDNYWNLNDAGDLGMTFRIYAGPGDVPAANDNNLYYEQRVAA